MPRVALLLLNKLFQIKVMPKDTEETKGSSVADIVCDCPSMVAYSLTAGTCKSLRGAELQNLSCGVAVYRLWREGDSLQTRY